MKTFLVAALVVLAAPAMAQTPPAPPAPEAPPPPPVFATVKIAMQTAQGRIVLALEKQRAPVTTANFLRYVDQKRFDGITFYRALKLADGQYGLVQAGVRGNAKRVLAPIAHEPTTKTGLTHDDGAISMARLAPGTAAGDFFLIIGNLPSLDANPAGTGDTQGYAVFGHVIEGMDVVHKILEAPISPTAGEGAMKGQMIAAPVAVTTVRRLPGTP